jgi:hypothetical protein
MQQMDGVSQAYHGNSGTLPNIRGQSYRLREKRKAGVFTELNEPAKTV